MRFYTTQHRFYCSIDLHARTMHLCIVDHAGTVVLDKKLPTRPDALLRAIELDGADRLPRGALRRQFAVHQAGCNGPEPYGEARVCRAKMMKPGTAVSIQ
jgi:hypothetical protein